MAATILWGLLMLPGFGAAMMSPMMFDAPGSLQDRSLVLVAWCVVAFPLLCIASIVASWVGWSIVRRAQGSQSTALLAGAFALPLLPVIVVAIVASLHHGPG